MVLKNVTIDDRDANTIKYQGFWFNTGSYNATSIGGSGTLSSTNDPNANFTIDTPPIVAFYYFGIKRSNGGFYQICIDCDPNNRQWVDIDAVNITDNGQNPPVVLFSTNWTDAQPHEIILTNRPDTRFPNGNSQLTLDDLVYTIEDHSPAPAPAPVPSLSPSPSSSPKPSSSSSGKSNGTLVAAVVSSVIGSLLILFIVLFVIRWRRTQRGAQPIWKANAAESQMTQTYTEDLNGAEVDPFPLSQDQSRPPFPLPFSKRQGLSSTNRDLGHQNSSSLTKNDPTRSPSYSQPLPSQSTSSQAMYSESNPRREEDAGSIHGFSEYGDTLPPDYQDATRRRMTREAS